MSFWLHTLLHKIDGKSFDLRTKRRNERHVTGKQKRRQRDKAFWNNESVDDAKQSYEHQPSINSLDAPKAKATGYHNDNPEDWIEDAHGVLMPRHLAKYGMRERRRKAYSGPAILQAESEEDPVEYKLRISISNRSRFQQLATQLRWRLSQGNGESFYCIGVEDNGHPRGLDKDELDNSLKALEKIASEVGAVIEVMEILPGMSNRSCAIVRVHHETAATSSASMTNLREVRVVVAGASSSGKSTLVSVLTHGIDGKPTLDNGRGSARMTVHRHKHEVASGRTSSMSVQVVGYGPNGTTLNYSLIAGGASPSPKEIAGAAESLVRLVDVSGHERFTKTSLHGIVSSSPDYACVCVCGRQGFSWITRDHLGVLMALNVPSCVVITKAEQVDENRIKELVDLLEVIVSKSRVTAMCADSKQTLRAYTEIRQGKCDTKFRAAHLVTTVSAAESLASHVVDVKKGVIPFHETIIPVFAVSNVTGDSLSLLHVYLRSLKGLTASHSNRMDHSLLKDPVEPAITPEIEDKKCSRDEDCLDINQTVESKHINAKQFQMDNRRANQSSFKFQIEAAFVVENIGPVLSGSVTKGCLYKGDILYHGTDDLGAFNRIKVLSIHRFKVEVNEVREGQHATIAVEYVDGQTEIGLAESQSRFSLKDACSNIANDLDEKEYLTSYELSIDDNIGTDYSTGQTSKPSSTTGDESGVDMENNRNSEHTIDILGRSWGESRACVLLQNARASSQKSNGEISRVHSFNGIDKDSSGHLCLEPSVPSELCTMETSSAKVILPNAQEPAYRIDQNDSFTSEIDDTFVNRSMFRARRGSILLDQIPDESVRRQFEAYLIVSNNRAWQDWFLEHSTDELDASESFSCTEYGPSMYLSRTATSDSLLTQVCQEDDELPMNTNMNQAAESAKNTIDSESESRMQLEMKTISGKVLDKTLRRQYAPMVHCDGVRQIAHVVSFELVDFEDFISHDRARACRSFSAMTAIQEAEENISASISRNTYCIRVTLRFQHRQEYMESSSPLILRDLETGKVSGIGIVI